MGETMRLIKPAIIIFLGLMASSAVKAEYGCQSGFVPVYQGNRQVCVADYNLPVWKQQNQQQQQPAEIWEDRYGAVARSGITQGYTISADQKTKRDAEKKALLGCGVQCKIISTFRNSCLGVSWGGGKTLFRGGGGLKEAEQKSLVACEESGSDCELISSACSLPVRVQ